MCHPPAVVKPYNKRVTCTLLALPAARKTQMQKLMCEGRLPGLEGFTNNTCGPELT